MQMIQFMAAPTLAFLVLVGIHAYFGIHVIDRGIIFVDLSLAQIVALGASIALLMGYEPGSNTAHIFGLCFTLFGALVFTLTRTRHERIPQEAIIGIVYAVASAATILVLGKTAHGAEEIKAMLVANIEWVTYRQVAKTAVIYALVGGFHFIFRRKFEMITAAPEVARSQGISIKLWDFLFYASFGVVLVSSVSLAGVLLVFTLLIVPSIAGLLFATTWPRRLLVAYTLGTIASVTGCVLSYKLDFPTVAMVITTLGAMLLTLALIRWGMLWRRKPALAETLNEG